MKMKNLFYFLLILFLLNNQSWAHYGEFTDEDGNRLEIQLIPDLVFQYDYCDDCQSDLRREETKAYYDLYEIHSKCHIYLRTPFNPNDTGYYIWNLGSNIGNEPEYRWMKSHFKLIVSSKFRTGHVPYPNYTEIAQRYDYLYYWFNLCFIVELKDLNEMLADVLEQIKREERCYNKCEKLIVRLKESAKVLEARIKELPKDWDFARESAEKSFQTISRHFGGIYNFCIKEHHHPRAYFERSKLSFDQGKIFECLDDIFTLIEMGYDLTPSMQVALGTAYNDANLYNQAIKVLSEAIHKDPQLKEAYYERAFSYFELGNLQLAISDYLLSGMRPTFLNDRDYKHFVFSIGVGMGCAKGGFDSALEFVPSLFSTMHGLGTGLWALAGDPIGISKEVIEDTIGCIDYIRNNLTPELLATLVPELKECIQKWNQLDDEKKGYYVGYVIGRYGVDALMCGGTVRAIQLYRNLRKANSILTLEKAATSPANAEILAKASNEFFLRRTEYKKKCKLHLGQQEKHIPGANNFQPGKSELTITVEHLEEMVSTKLGEGIPIRFSLGEAGYRELVEFDEIIGLHVDLKTGSHFPTSVGEIHYDRNGAYHVVPVDPNKIQRILSKRKKI